MIKITVRTAARMIVEVGTSFNSVEASVGVTMSTSAFECVVCDGESNSVVGGRVVAAGLMVLAGLGMAMLYLVVWYLFL